LKKPDVVDRLAQRGRGVGTVGQRGEEPWESGWGGRRGRRKKMK